MATVLKDYHKHIFVQVKEGRKYTDLLCFRRSKVDLLRAKIGFVAALSQCDEIDVEVAIEHFRLSHLKRSTRAQNFFSIMEKYIMDVKNASTQELVAKYNELTGKSIKKFSSRAAGEAQVEKLLQDGKAKQSEAKPQPKKEIAPKAQDLGLAGQVKATAKAVKEKKVASPKEPVDRSAAIAASWNDPETKALRSIKHKVMVAGQQYSSVHTAFEALKLPMGKVIKFRAELKATHEATFDGHKFKLVPRADAASAA